MRKNKTILYFENDEGQYLEELGEFLYSIENERSDGPAKEYENSVV